MFLDTKYMRYLTSEDWKVLTAVSLGHLHPDGLRK